MQNTLYVLAAMAMAIVAVWVAVAINLFPKM